MRPRASRFASRLPRAAKDDGARAGASLGLRRVLGTAVLVAMLGPVQPAAGPALAQPRAGAEPAAPPAPAFELGPAVRRELFQMQERWLQWLAHLESGDLDRGEELGASLLDQVRKLGFQHLPDLALGASARAVEAARRDDFQRADWALAAAESFDPGLPETAFARSAVQRLAGRQVAAFFSELDGYRRLLDLSQGRSTGLASLLLWGLAALLVTGGLFLALQVGVKGKALLEDLESLPGLAGLPALISRPLALLLVLWPLALPHGPFWWLLWVSGLLLAYASPSERLVIVGLWLVAGLAPLAVSEASRRVERARSAPERALGALAEGRLHGHTFNDLEDLAARLPGEPAVDYLLADVHRRIGQWDAAQSLYERVRESEPDNVQALIDLGTYYFYKRDFGNARLHFQQATEIDPDSVVAYFNLSRSYSEGFLFNESGQALLQAQSLDEAEVSRLLEVTGEQEIVIEEAGIARADEVRRRLEETRTGGETPGPGDDLLQRRLVALVAGMAMLIGLSLLWRLVLRDRGLARTRSFFHPGEGASHRLLRALIPGLEAVRERRGLHSFLALLLPAALLTLATLAPRLYPVVLRFGVEAAAAGVFGWGALVALFGVRLAWELSPSR